MGLPHICSSRSNQVGVSSLTKSRDEIARHIVIIKGYNSTHWAAIAALRPPLSIDASNRLGGDLLTARHVWLGNKAESVGMHQQNVLRSTTRPLGKILFSYSSKKPRLISDSATRGEDFADAMQAAAWFLISTSGQGGRWVEFAQRNPSGIQCSMSVNMFLASEALPLQISFSTYHNHEKTKREQGCLVCPRRFDVQPECYVAHR